MPTWSGWIIQFLNAANVINTPPNQTFLSEWAKHDNSKCANAPIVLSAFVKGASRCGATVTDFGYTYKYPSHAAAAHAFDIEIHNTRANALLDALNTGNPFQIGDRSAAVEVLKHWGSPSFARWYANATTGGGTGGGGGGGGIAPHTHKAWTDAQRAINNRLPSGLSRADRVNRETLRILHRMHKVRP